jgi:hypothetical protein
MFFCFPPDPRWNPDDGNVEITGRDLREREVQERRPRRIGYRRVAP